MSEGNSKTSTGIQQNTAGLLCYLGWWITGIIFFVIEKENKVVRFHAVQSIIVFGLISVVLIVLSPIGAFVPFFGVIIYIIDIFAFILWIVMMVMTVQGKMTKLPWAGKLAEKYANPTTVQPSEEKKDQPK